MTRDQALAAEAWERVDATYLVVDIRGWSDIVHALGPDPARAARLVGTFWAEAEDLVRARRGEVYSWQGDALLVAYRGRPHARMERALGTVEAIHALTRIELEPLCWELLRRAEAEAQATAPVPGGPGAVSRAVHFAVSSAVTDGTAIAVPRGGAGRRGRDWYCEELTGDCVNLAFVMVKEVPPNHVGLTGEVHATLRRQGSGGLGSFSWVPARSVRLAGAERLIHTGTPTAVARPAPVPADRPRPVPPGTARSRAVH